MPSDTPEPNRSALNTPTSFTLHIRIPGEDLRQIRSLVPGRFIGLAEAARALLRNGLRMELDGADRG
jgi:hypothetical protein